MQAYQDKFFMFDKILVQVKEFYNSGYIVVQDNKNNKHVARMGQLKATEKDFSKSTQFKENKNETNKAVESKKPKPD